MTFDYKIIHILQESQLSFIPGCHQLVQTGYPKIYSKLTD